LGGKIPGKIWGNSGELSGLRRSHIGNGSFPHGSKLCLLTGENISGLPLNKFGSLVKPPPTSFWEGGEKTPGFV